MDGTSSDPFASRHEVADYISAMAGELARIAATHDLAVLRYLLEMARLEAHSVVLAEGGEAGG